MPSRAVERRRPLILVVDDDPGVRDPLAKFLTMHGFDIVAAESVDSAQERLRDHQVQGAVIDLRLPQGSGREVILLIPPPTPVIIFRGAQSRAAGTHASEHAPDPETVLAGDAGRDAARHDRGRGEERTGYEADPGLVKS